MPDRTQLPYLIKLLEDESPIVHASVLAELESFGDSLERELMLPDIGIPSVEILKIRQYLRESGRERLREQWQAMLSFKNEKERLESAHMLLSQYIGGRSSGPALASALDALAHEFRTEKQTWDARSLAIFLFKQKSLRGVDSNDYLDPRNSSLTHVLLSGSGLPISLCSICILVGSRLGIPIEGCNFPGHFMATAIDGDKKIIIDCYHGGVILDESLLESLSLSARVTMADLIQLECGTDPIIMRVLRNLVNAFNHVNDKESANFIEELHQMLEKSE